MNAPLSKKCRRRPENEVQAQIVGFLRAVLNPRDALVYANPNAARRTAGGNASNAVPGLTPGIPDLSIVIKGGRVFYFEVKASDGKLSEAQQRMLARMDEMGVPATVVRSIDDVRGALALWEIKTREASLHLGKALADCRQRKAQSDQVGETA